jgi:predicted nucleic acid-binding protein
MIAYRKTNFITSAANSGWRRFLADSLILYSQKNIDFMDAYNALFMKFHGLEKIYSYDRDFDSIEGIEREEP